MVRSSRSKPASGHVPKNAAPGTREVSVSMQQELFDLLRQRAIDEDRSVSNMAALLIRRGMKAQEK